MSIAMGSRHGPRLPVERRPMTDPELLQARDVAIVQLREGLYPYRHPHTWRQIGPKVRVSHVMAWKRYRFKIPDEVKEDIRLGYLG